AGRRRGGQGIRFRLRGGVRNRHAVDRHRQVGEGDQRRLRRHRHAPGGGVMLGVMAGNSGHDALSAEPYFSMSLTLSSPACTQGSSLPPGEPDTAAAPMTSSPTLIGRPPAIAMTFGSVTCCRTPASPSAKRLAVTAEGTRNVFD